MVKLRVHEARKEQYRSGDALDWSVLDFRTRRHAMVQSLVQVLERKGGLPPVCELTIDGRWTCTCSSS